MSDLGNAFGFKGVEEGGGMPIRVWYRAQKQRQMYLYDLRHDNPAFLLLPVTHFSPCPAHHSPDLCRFYDLREPPDT